MPSLSECRSYRTPCDVALATERRVASVSGGRTLKVLESVTDVRDVNPGTHVEGALHEPCSLRWRGEPRSRQLVDCFDQTDRVALGNYPVQLSGGGCAVSCCPHKSLRSGSAEA